MPTMAETNSPMRRSCGARVQNCSRFMSFNSFVCNEHRNHEPAVLPHMGEMPVDVSTSTDGGTTWKLNPTGATIPGDDRECGSECRRMGAKTFTGVCEG